MSIWHSISSIVITNPAPLPVFVLCFLARNGLGFDPCPHSGRVPAQPCGYLKVQSCVASQP